MDPISLKYTGKPFPTMESETRGSRRVFFALSEPSPVQIRMRSPSRPTFPELEIVAKVVVKFTASPHGVFVGDCVRLWPSHYGRPFALAALEGINYRSVNLAVGNDGSHPSHSNSLSQSYASRVPAASPCVMGLFSSGETTCDKVAIGWNPLWRTLLRLWARMSGRLCHRNSSQHKAGYPLTFDATITCPCCTSSARRSIPG
jgi:hypothetical protein